MSEDDKLIYITMSLYNLKEMLKLPKEIKEMILYLKQIRPHKFNYELFEEYERNLIELYGKKFT